MTLTAARTGEAIGATFDEVNIAEAVWNVPAERMKGGKPHSVPLPARCIEIIEQARSLPGSSRYIFPGSRPNKPLSNMAMLMRLRRAGLDCTVHGFRSSFRDWAAEQTGIPGEVAEAALAHAVKSKVEAAYKRTRLFNRRRELMDAWAAFLANEGAQVIPMRAAE